MDKKRISEHRDKINSAESYREKQRAGGNFLFELVGDGLKGIGGFIGSRREAKERERERLERERIEREKTERRKRILKTLSIIVIIVGLGTGVFFLARKVFFGNSDTLPEISTSAEVQPLETEIETIDEDTQIMDIAPEYEKEVSGRSKDFFKKVGGFFIDSISGILDKILDMPQSNVVFSTVGYCLFGLWLIIAIAFLFLFIIKAIIAIFGGIAWSKVGHSLLSSGILVISTVILYNVFKDVLEKPLTGTIFARTLDITAFALFLFANIVMINIIRAKNKKAKWGNAIKMAIIVVIIYIPVILLR